MGDPSGIGPEIVVGAAEATRKSADVVVFGDADVLGRAIDVTGVDLDVNRIPAVGDAAFERGTLDVVDLDNVDAVTFGTVDAAYGRASIEYVEHATERAIDGHIDAMANAPINKAAMGLAGSEYAGHTNLLADRTGADETATLLVADAFVVSHATLHVPLAEVVDLITPDRVATKLRLTAGGLERLGIEDPSIAVTGLNPHAGEGGVLGDEDDERIAPGIETARADGIDARGPLPADSIFNQAIAGHYDCVLAMYHDQGHVAAFVGGYVEGGGVSTASMTAGLPIVRTTTLHGTAHGIAGEGTATPASMISAIETAARAAEGGD